MCETGQATHHSRKAHAMKCSKSQARSKARALPEVRIGGGALTALAGLVVFQAHFLSLELKARLQNCLNHLQKNKSYSQGVLYLLLVYHLLIGYRNIRDIDCYRHDPMILQALGLRQLPDVSTVCRLLKAADPRAVENLRLLLRELLFARLAPMRLARITLDFDGSVISTTRRAEGTAVGFNKRKKGARSYYPLFCTIAQSGQVFDFLHRAGNVHDSRGAREFILACVSAVREALPSTIVEVRMDSAFFSDELVTALDTAGVEFTISVPFERFAKLKEKTEARRRWRFLRADTSFFALVWKPESWTKRYRFLFIRTRVKKQQKGEIQLDLFVPHEFGYEFKVVVTNKDVSARAVVEFHEGRGAQEGIFAELKTHCAMGHVPVRTRAGNQLYLLAGIFAHNLARDMQMQSAPPSRRTNARRTPLWIFERLDTVRRNFIHRAGRYTRPQGKRTLQISLAAKLKAPFLALFTRLQSAA